MASIKNETPRVPDIKATIVGSVLALAFKDGTNLRVDAQDLPQAVCNYAMMHGLKQKLVDAAAISRNTETGRSASLEDKIAAVEEVLTRLREGEWNKAREGGGGTGGLLFAALCELYSNRTAEQIKEFLAGKSDKEQAALRMNPRIAPIIKRISEERAQRSGAGSVDTEELLSGLEDLGAVMFR